LETRLKFSAKMLADNPSWLLFSLSCR